MYEVVLFVHSHVRWLVVLGALLLIARMLQAKITKRPWEQLDERLGKTVVALADLQFTLGLLLYLWLSPMVRAAFADMGAAMKSAPLRFFAVEHVTAMVVAVSLLHIGWVRARRASDPARRHAIVLRWSCGFLVAVAVGIPWPGLRQARPLFRSSIFEDSPLADQASPQAPQLFAKRCAACHGTAGRGDGVAGSAMQPPARDLTEGAWQANVSDAELRQVILQGGGARQLSTNMPPHPDLRAEQVDELVRYIRSLAPAR